MKKAAAILLFGLILVPFGAEAQTKPATIEQANQMILLLQKQLDVLQEQLKEFKGVNAKATKPVYYASLESAKQGKCAAIVLKESDGTPGINQTLSVSSVREANGKIYNRKAKELKTDDEGKALYCQDASKLTVKSKYLKQDTVLKITNVSETPVPEKPAQKVETCIRPKPWSGSSLPPLSCP